jgi:hypothetical protein
MLTNVHNPYTYGLYSQLTTKQIVLETHRCLSQYPIYIAGFCQLVRKRVFPRKEFAMHDIGYPFYHIILSGASKATSGQLNHTYLFLPRHSFFRTIHNTDSGRLTSSFGRTYSAYGLSILQVYEGKVTNFLHCTAKNYFDIQEKNSGEGSYYGVI